MSDRFRVPSRSSERGFFDRDDKIVPSNAPRAMPGMTHLDGAQRSGSGTIVRFGTAVWARTSTGCLLGADRAGARGRTSEAIGHFVANSLLADLAAGGTVDRHAADQLVIFGALAAGTTRYIAPSRTDHVETNLWLAEQFGARVRCEHRQVEVDGMTLRR